MNRFAIAAAFLASSLIAAAGPAFAQLDCGNGVLNFGEECDDGNLIPGDCCSPGCRFEAPGSVCRAATEECDAIEKCTGESGTCPADTGIIGDNDADGYCDPIDPCPASADPDPLLDSDSDGVGDACDPCTGNLTRVRGFRLRVRKFQLPTGQQRLLFRGDFAVPDQPEVNPLAKPIRLLMTDARGLTVFDTTIPPVPYDAGTRVGWNTYGGGRWVFDDGIDQIPGIDKAVLHVKPAREPLAVDVSIRLEARGNIDVIKPMFPGELTLTLDTAPVTNSLCAEIPVDSIRCNFRNSGNKLYCR